MLLDQCVSEFEGYKYSWSELVVTDVVLLVCGACMLLRGLVVVGFAVTSKRLKAYRLEVVIATTPAASASIGGAVRSSI